jgi:RHS repeat-associated protein
LYSGEQFDSKIGQQYLRARYYDPATGRFNRLDPFFGNLNDPQSLHKYLYCHADPISMTDPSGKIGALGIGIGAALIGSVAGALLAPSLGISRTAGALGGAFALPFTVFFPGAVAAIVVGGFEIWGLSILLNGATEYRNHLYKLSEFNMGGLTLTESLMLNFRQNVIDEWNGLDHTQKQALIDSLHSLKDGLIAWDIHDMAFDGKKYWTWDMVQNDIPCAKETLTYNGKVYPVAEVNYLLWGLIN